jgi:N-acetylmuramoyl-L-alanine amidase
MSKGSYFYGSYNSTYIVCGDDGHGKETAGKRSPSGIRENEFNHYAKMYMFEALKRCKIACYDVSPTRQDNSLSNRTSLANAQCKTASDTKRVIYISIHYDGYGDGTDFNEVQGLSVYHYPGSASGLRLAKAVHSYLVKGTKQKDRGIKTANFHVLRETKMPAILSENGFMTHKWESSLMRNKQFQQEVGEEHCKGICSYLGVRYIAPKKASPTTIYRVQVGAFANRENANQLVKSLKKDGYPAFIK